MKAVNEKCKVVNFSRLTFSLSFADTFSVSGTFECEKKGETLFLNFRLQWFHFFFFTFSLAQFQWCTTWKIQPIKTKTGFPLCSQKIFQKLSIISFINFHTYPFQCECHTMLKFNVKQSILLPRTHNSKKK